MAKNESIAGKQQTYRDVPVNNLDFNMQVIDPDWQKSTPSILEGKDYASTDYVTIDGQDYINVRKIITNLDFYTRDIRLSNYDKDELREVRWWLEFAGKMADHKYFQCFNYCLMQAARISETSQGKAGFLRKILQTLTTENINRNVEPPKKNFWSGKQNNGGA